ncbi:hypothetical protein [Bacillus cereus]|uniref:hypothetical protein n=1 Tax=Bacillus cereus TaxID=1396 RepID=UPI000BF2AE69|nr:hypothetical protein [Bacillus cereus]PFQ13503.1 hypothetical protein COK14_09120 [Bacillus cereus]
MSEPVKYKQMSIYDFLPEEKSQELPPSETVAQVDETQEEKRIPVMFRHEWKTESPSSALDTCPTCSYPMQFPSYRFCTNVNCEYLKPTEDTDSTLFSVGDVLTVKSPDEVYSMDTHPEDYYHLQEHQGKKVVITSRRKAYRGVFYGTSIEENGKVPFFYHRELKI